MNATVAILVCVLALRPSHTPAERREDVARAFLAAVRPHAPLDLLLAVGFVESRWNPTGSRADRDRGMFGVMQLYAPDLVCRDRHGRPDERRCSEAQRIARDRILDPGANILRGALLLAHRWARFHVGHDQDWFGSYTVGHIPAPITRAFSRYVVAVRQARGLVRGWVRNCGNSGSERIRPN